MLIDISRCTSCGDCADVCTVAAISMRGSTAVINRDTCTGCGRCARVCPTGAIRAGEAAHAISADSGWRVAISTPDFQDAAKAKTAVDGVRHGYTSGKGGGDMYGRHGCGFKGDSPSWPYLGRGRGGLPRCSYPGAAGAFPYSRREMHYPAPPAREQELGFLREAAGAMRRHLEDIEARTKEMEARPG